MPGRLMSPATVKTTGGSKRERFMKGGGSKPYHHRNSLAKMDTKSQVPSLLSNYASSCRNSCSKKLYRSKSLDLSIENLAALTLDLIEFWKQFPVKTREIATLRELTKCQLMRIKSRFSQRKKSEDSDLILLEGSCSESCHQETHFNESTKEEVVDSEDRTGSEKKGKNEVRYDNVETWNPWNGSTIDYYQTSNSRDSYAPELSYNYLLMTEGNGFQSAQKTFDSFFAENEGFLGHTGKSCVCLDTVVVKRPLYQR